MSSTQKQMVRWGGGLQGQALGVHRHRPEEAHRLRPEEAHLPLEAQRPEVRLKTPSSPLGLRQTFRGGRQRSIGAGYRQRQRRISLRCSSNVKKPGTQNAHRILNTQCNTRKHTESPRPQNMESWPELLLLVGSYYFNRFKYNVITICPEIHCLRLF